jgi:hypothetical protein
MKENFLPKLIIISCLLGLKYLLFFKKIWKSEVLHKQKVFVWLLLVDRLNTRDMMDRRNWHLHSGVDCETCSGHERETREHLFFNCRFAQKIWHFLNITWINNDSIIIMFQRAKASFQGPNFIEVATCAFWGIWKVRNAKIFEGKQPSFQVWRAVFKQDLALVSHRVKPVHRELLFSWLNSF